jgi:hypothetical protein
VAERTPSCAGPDCCRSAKPPITEFADDPSKQQRDTDPAPVTMPFLRMCHSSSTASSGRQVMATVSPI